jgi:hypothetical protein
MRPSDIRGEAARLLENICGFAVGVHPSSLAMFPSTENCSAVAGDGMGGVFYEWHEQQRGAIAPIVYLSCYGEASRFADSFQDALTIVIAFPTYWGDILVSATKGNDVNKLVVEHYEEGLEQGAKEARLKLCSLLQLRAVNALEMLSRAIRVEPAFRPMLRSSDGLSEATLFSARPYPC